VNVFIIFTCCIWCVTYMHYIPLYPKLKLLLWYFGHCIWLKGEGMAWSYPPGSSTESVLVITTNATRVNCLTAANSSDIKAKKTTTVKLKHEQIADVSKQLLSPAAIRDWRGSHMRNNLQRTSNETTGNQSPSTLFMSAQRWLHHRAEHGATD